MRRFKALLYKDILLLIRDLPGLAMMFIMPLALVILMTYLQDSTFNSITENKIPLLLLDEDQDSLGISIERSIRQSHIFNVDTTLKEERLTASSLEKAVAKGDYQIGIVIPKNTTENIRQSIRQSVLKTFGSDSASTAIEMDSIAIFVDPTTKNSFKSTIISSIQEYAAKLQTGFVLREVSIEVKRLLPIPMGEIEISEDMIGIKEQYARLDQGRLIPNSVQHNVPAWGMFAVFFIVISLAGSIIKEREDGSFTRLMTMPCPYWLYLMGKAGVYLMVCLLQLLLMFLMGIYILPMLGLPALEMGHCYGAIILMSISSSLAAIGYGIAIGKIATSNQQSAIFGSISVVIMAAIGGVWIPVFVMPNIMQTLSKISPLNWGLSGYYDIFVRDGDLLSVLPESGTLLVFAILCVVTAIVYDRKKRR
ncbi:MAG TPA: ABC transporter permease [Paludibacteraceae bacterium]|jgi:ABC-2 type transport system permease protein|nr:ABC transporter permease [Paludibacteraceae bacterium]HOU67818.1 ABC transporter permease [Paludibacteraceae bacterium]HPH62089.1 ABC transporter permease [Paludibacteraceae bacterium]HQF49369.1 ABC transporter permease [Paludibacteraceae bacterium]